jgi:hypothetical protein
MNNKVTEIKASSVIDTSICPLCQQKNCCTVELAANCWCAQTDIPAALLATIPEDLQGKSCICARCIRQYHQQKR